MGDRVIRCDVLIIGGGGAAARAAVEASDSGATVNMALKGRLGKSGSTVFPVSLHGTFGAVDDSDPDDSIERHYQDTMVNAQGMCDPRLARIVAQEAPLALRKLAAEGVPFLSDSHGQRQRWQGCFASHPRSHRIEGHGGPIMHALIQQIAARPITVNEKIFIEDLLVQDGMCIGAIGVDTSGHRTFYLAGATVLGTGGAGQLFKANINPKGITGDGYAMAWRAGARMVNMEFMQTGIGILTPLTLMSAWTWAYKPTLRNSDGEEFLQSTLPLGLTVEDVYQAKTGHFPFSSRDISKYLEVGILQQQREGRTVHYDMRNSPRLAEYKTMPMFPWLLKRGLDLENATAQISVYAQAINGGVLIDEFGSSSLPGLYAAGEVAGGAHGADRLGGAMLSNSQIFGARCGRYAAERALSNPKPNWRGSWPAEIVEAPDEARSQACEVDRTNLTSLMFDALLIERNGATMASAEIVLNELQSRWKDAPRSWAEHELRNQIQTGLLMLRAAQTRRESRGSHFRSDFPNRDDSTWGRVIAQQQVNNESQLKLIDLHVVS